MTSDVINSEIANKSLKYSLYLTKEKLFIAEFGSCSLSKSIIKKNGILILQLNGKKSCVSFDAGDIHIIKSSVNFALDQLNSGNSIFPYEISDYGRTNKEYTDISSVELCDVTNILLDFVSNFGNSLSKCYLDNSKATYSQVTTHLENSFGSVGSHTYEHFFLQGLLRSSVNSSYYLGGSSATTIKSLDIDGLTSSCINIAVDYSKADSLEVGTYDVLFSCDCLDELFSKFIERLYTLPQSKRDALTKVIGKQPPFRVDFVDSSDGNFTKPLFDITGRKLTDVYVIKNGRINTSTFQRLSASFSNGYLKKTPRNGFIKRNLYSTYCSQPDRYLFINQILASSSSCNLLTGEFRVRGSGFVVCGGVELSTFFNEPISGNFFKLLSELEFLGDNVCSNFESDFYSPNLLLRGINVC
ncbi:metallopeptidase TldD-related protein [Agarivorans sp. B2Z047]|uniref:metallopeptidase TldD-related protein n=1 Tax=Agarivorans sp. B2Z047 TaxID=2652721 RepID=UPI0018846FF6|nr:metallopeptidase TldD-related protein [Agarivorans sp. B2Z047]UQN41942.1 metallopeptidase TldD-related protein [Agarivorans sp. B2Z047]